MKKKLFILVVLLFAWSATSQAQFDAWKLLKSSTALDTITIIGPNLESDSIYFGFYDQKAGVFWDSIIVVLTFIDINNIDSVRIGFDYSPDNTNWVGTFADSVYLIKAAGTTWVTALPPNTGRVAKNLPVPRYAFFTLWGENSAAATDTAGVTAWKIYGYHKPTTIIRR